MVVEWKEREHDSVDALVIEDEASMDALRDCGLKNSSSCRTYELNLSYYNT